MCGIFGRIGGRNDDSDALATLSLQHRGPDDTGLWIDGDDSQQCLIFGHTRLSILDLSSAGHQPMLSQDGRYALCFNGEIYNFKALRRDLERRGVRFHSQTDTEVVLETLILKGDAGLTDLEGMFALALWDRLERRLLVARDPVGIKPLYWRQGPDELAFASELKALLVDPRVTRQPNDSALCGYLQYLYVPAPHTAFANHHSLLPGHQLVWQDGEIQLTRFHQFKVTPKLQLDLADATQQLETLLQTVIAEQMVADVPVGAFLSGGIDSGLIVALMAQQKRELGHKEPLRTFTVAFGSEGKNWDESGAARGIAERLGAQHHVVAVQSRDAIDRIVAVADAFDEPFANPTAIAHDVLCQGARKHVTVALAGDGGDEAFAGYPRHRATWLLSLWNQMPPLFRRALTRAEARLPEQAEALPLLRQARRFLRTGGGTFADIYRDWSTFFDGQGLTNLLTPNTLQTLGGSVPRDLGGTLLAMAEIADAHPVDAACYADIACFLPDNVLRESDRMSMRHALEVRVPFADRRVLQFGLQLPVDVKMPWQSWLQLNGAAQSKLVLRKVAEKWLPRQVVHGPKRGFGAPMGAWLQGPLRLLLEEMTSDSVVARRGLVRPDVVAQLRNEHLTGKRDRTWPLWAMMMLEIWYQRRIDILSAPATARDRVAVVQAPPWRAAAEMVKQ